MCTSRHHSKNFWRSGEVFDLVDIFEIVELADLCKAPVCYPPLKFILPIRCHSEILKSVPAD